MAMRRSKQRQPLSPRDFTTQANELETELTIAREVRDLWLKRARGIGKDRTSEFKQQIARLEDDLDDLRRRAQQTEGKRMGDSPPGASGMMGQAWGD